MENREKCRVDNFVDDYAMSRIDQRVIRIGDAFGLNEEERQDLRQDMVVELLSASSRFDPRKASRKTFINRVLRLYEKHRMRQEYTLRNRPCNAPTSFEDFEDGFDMAVNDPRAGEFSEQTRTELRLDLADAIRQMPEQLQCVCRELMEVGPAEAAKRLGVSRQTIYSRMLEIRRHLKLAGLDFFGNSLTDRRRLQM